MSNSGDEASGTAALPVTIDGKPAQLVVDDELLYLCRNGSSGTSAAFDPLQAFLALPHVLILHCSIVADSDGGSLFLRFLSPPPGNKKVKAWLKRRAIDAQSDASSARQNFDALRNLLGGPFASIKLIKTEARVAPEHVESAKAWAARTTRLAYTSPLSGLAIKPFRRLRVLVNPVGGQGKAKALYETRVRPILEAAGCKLDTTFTTHRNHGLEIARDEESLPSSHDAIVCVSGDGMLHEVLNGLATRPNDAVHALNSISVVPIPTGSGNATSVCLLGPEQGFNLAQACLNVIKGQPLALDICTVTQPASSVTPPSQHPAKRFSSIGRKASRTSGISQDDAIPASTSTASRTEGGSDDPVILPAAPPLPFTRYYSFLSQAIGLMADVDIGTDHMRALGDSRFIIGYIGGVISNVQAPVLVDVKLGAKGTISRAEMRARAAERRSNSQPDDHSVEQAGADAALPALRHGSVMDDLGGDQLPDLDIVDPSWPKVEALVAKSKLIAQKATPSTNGSTAATDGSAQASPAPGWARVRHPIDTLYAGKIPYVARDLLQFPYTLPGDGTIDISLLLHAGGRMAKIRTVGGAETGAAIYDKAISYLKVEAFRVTPVLPAGDKRLKQGGLISIDGEQVPYAPFQVEVTPGLQLKVLSVYGNFLVPTLEPPSGDTK